jgi:hypothetical protein
METTLKKMFQEHKGKVTDKWALYLEEWDRIFAPYRNRQLRLLEIGIQNGGSLEIWCEYFSNAVKIVGCDIDQKCECLRYDDSRIAVIIGDTNSDKSENDILQQSPTFDIIIDDGSHVSSDIIRSFARYFSHLNDNGIYIVEDLHTSYWKDYGGGLYNPFSAISFFKRLADVINYEHWRNNSSRRNLLAEFCENLGIKFEDSELSRIHSIEFVNSMCIIKKLPTDRNILGKRKVVGTVGCVTDGWVKNNNTLIQDISVVIEDDKMFDVFNLMNATNSLSKTVAEMEYSIQSLTSQLSDREQEIQILNTQLNQVNSELNETKAEVLKYVLSKSWRMTRPLRKAMNLFRGRRK